MPEGLPIDSAADTFERLLGKESPGSALTLAPVLDAFERFARLGFEVAAVPDADGCLVTHGVSDGLEGKTFSVRLARRFAVPGAGGRHDGHVRVFCELTYEAADGFDELGNRNEWWFRGANGERFGAWWQATTRPLLAAGLGEASPSSVEIGTDGS